MTSRYSPARQAPPEIRALMRAIEDTSAQLRELIAQVASLTTSAQVHHTLLRETERRIGALETRLDDGQHREQERGDQRQVSFQVMALSAAISLLSSLILLALSHVPWR